MAKKGHFVVDDTIGISLLTALSFRQDNGQYLLITSNLYKAQKIYQCLLPMIGKDNVLLFPTDELIRTQTLAQSKEMVAQRLYVLNEIIKGRGKVIIANLASILRYLPSPQIFADKCLDFVKGGHYDLKEIKKNLIKNGYLKVNKVDQSMQFAVRGDILDIYSVNNNNPVRIEFFDDEVESIRYFDLATQVSIKELDKISILPGNDILLSEEEVIGASDKIMSILEKDQTHIPLGLFESLRNLTESDISEIIEGQPSQKLYKYYSLLTKEHYSLLDYCPNYLRVLVDTDSLEQANTMMLNESHEYLSELHEKGINISHLELYQDLNKLINKNTYNTISTSKFFVSSNDLSFNVKNVPFIANKRDDALNIIQMYLNDGVQVVLNLPKKEQVNVIVKP